MEPFFQIQPKYEERVQWEALAKREFLGYEVLELSAPPTLNDRERFCLTEKWYLGNNRCTSLHGAFIDVNVASGDADLRALSRQKSVLSCETALRLGVNRVVFHSSHFPFLRGAYTDNWAAQCADFYQELAERYDLNLLIENCQDIDPYPLDALMQRISDPRVGVCLDVGHANYSQAPVEKWFDQLGSRIAYLHLSDNCGQFDDHLPLGYGTVDWQKTDACWRQLHGTIPITLEVGTPAEAETSLIFLHRHSFFSR